MTSLILGSAEQGMYLRSMKKIAVLTTGGDAPGINASIRAVVLHAAKHKIHVLGVMEGFDGLIRGQFRELTGKEVSSMLQSGGTLLRSSRSASFRTPAGRKKALKMLHSHGVEGLIVIGGNGSLFGASVFSEESAFPVLGIPKTIDNDVAGTDFAIGFDTALNNAVRAIDKIRESAASHNRVFFVEVMGRDAGHIALHAGIASGSEVILIPETFSNLDMLEKNVRTHLGRQASPMIVIVAEGDDAGHAVDIVKRLKKRIRGFNPGVSVLGYIQRGGSPTVFDRYLGSAMGVKAVDLLRKGMQGVFVTYKQGKLGTAPLNKLRKERHPINRELIQLARNLGQIV